MLLLLYVCASQLIIGLLGICALRVLPDELLQCGSLCGVGLLHALCYGSAEQCVVGVLAVDARGLVIVLLCGGELTLVVIAVAYAAVGVGDNLLALASGTVHELHEGVACLVILLVLELDVSDVVCRLVAVAALEGCSLAVQLFCRSLVARLVERLAFPEERVGLCRPIEPRQLERAVHVVYRHAVVAVDELLYAKAVQNFLLCLENLIRRVVYLVY